MRKTIITTCAAAIVCGSAMAKGGNPFLGKYTTPYGIPPFEQIKVEHYKPAFVKGIEEHKKEIDAIVNNKKTATFENTIAALDRTGALLDRVTGVFFNILDADGNDEMNAIAEEEESNRKKNEFMANISHEIRTPLNAIVGFSEILSTSIIGKDEFDNREFTELIRSNSDLMLKLVNQIIDTPNDTASEVNLEKTNVVEVAEKVLYSTEALVKEGVKVVFNCPQKQIEIFTDRFRLQQLLTNLLGNAAKFTNEGSITLSINLNDVFVTFAVTDTGCGIPETDLPHIFEPFFTTKKAGAGTGLGLAIAAQVAEDHHGTIQASSKVGEGTAFTVALPRFFSPDPQNPTKS